MIAVPLAAALAVLAYVFLSGEREGPELPAETESPPTAESADSGGLGGAKPPPESQAGFASPTPAPEDRPPERKSERKGDLTRFSLTHGDIGYIDVNSILRDRNPYSIVDLLQAHGELTGAGDSLEIRIDRISENEIWGQEVMFTQMIEGRPTNEVGTVFFSPSGAVTWARGRIIDTRGLKPGGILVLAPEAEAIARDAAARHAATLEPENPEWRDLPVTITPSAAEIRYERDPSYKLVRTWRVGVGIGGPVATSLWVSVSPETGEVTQVKSAVVYCK